MPDPCLGDVNYLPKAIYEQRGGGGVGTIVGMVGITNLKGRVQLQTELSSEKRQRGKGRSERQAQKLTSKSLMQERTRFQQRTK